MADDELATSPHVAEGTMHAWLDGALSPEEARAVGLHVAICVNCSAVAAEARGMIAASTRILSALDGVPGNVIPAAAGSSMAGHRSPRVVRSAHIYGPIAAVALFAVGAVLFLRGNPSLVPTSAQPQESVTVPVAPRVENANATVVVAPPVPAGSAKGVPTVHPAAKPRAVVPAERRRAAAITRAADGASASSHSSSIRIEASKPALMSRTVPSSVVPNGVASDATSSQSVGSLAAASVDRRYVDEFASTPQTMTGARVVSTNEFNSGGSRVRRTVFAIDSVTTVTLTERRNLTAVESRAAANAEMAVSAAPLSLRGPSLQDVESVMWTSADGTLFTLSGSLTIDQLEALKSRLTPRP